MSDQLLGALKICLLVLLYLFFGRVLWAVWSEVRLVKAQSTDARAPGSAPARPAAPGPTGRAAKRGRKRGAPTPYQPPSRPATPTGTGGYDAADGTGASSVGATAGEGGTGGTASAAGSPPLGGASRDPMMHEGTEPTTRPASRPGDDTAFRERRELRPRRGTATRLVILEPRAMKGVSYPIGGELTLGRGTGCTICLADDTFLSTLHARIYVVAGQPTVEDLGSTNGSFLNGNRLAGPALLNKGDRLQLGNTVMEID